MGCFFAVLAIVVAFFVGVSIGDNKEKAVHDGFLVYNGLVYKVKLAEVKEK